MPTFGPPFLVHERCLGAETTSLQRAVQLLNLHHPSVISTDIPARSE